MSEKNDGFCDEREEGMISDDDEDAANAKEGCESSSGFHSNKDDYRNSHKVHEVKSKDSKTALRKHSVVKNGSGDEEVEEGQIPASPYKNNESSKSRSSRSKSRSRSVSRSRSKESSKASRSGSESKSASRSRSRSRSRNRRKRQTSHSRSRSRSRKRRSYSRSRSRSGTRSPYSGPIIKDYRRGRRGNFPPFNRFIRGRRPFRRGSFVPHHSYRKYQTYSRSRSKSGSPKRRLYHEREFEKEVRSPGTEEEKSEVLNPADIKKSQKQITQSFLAMLEEKQKKTRMLPLDYPKFEKSHNYNPRQHGFVNTFATVGASESSPKNSLSFELEKDGWQVIDDAETDSMRHKAYEGDEDGKMKSERKSTEDKNNSSDRSRKRRQSMSISGDSETDESTKLKSLVKSKKKSSGSSSSDEEEPKHPHKEKEKESKKKSKHKKKEKKKKRKRDDSSSSSEEDSKGKRRKSKKKKKHNKKYEDSESDEDEELNEKADALAGQDRGNEDPDVEIEEVEASAKKEKSKKKKKRSKSESSSDSDSEAERSRKKKNKKKRKKKRSKKRRRDSSSSSSSEEDSDSSDSDDKKKKSKKRKKKSKKAKKSKKTKKECSEKGKKKSSSKKKKGDEKANEAKKSEETSFVWPTAMICYTTTKPSLQYCVNPKYMCESKVEQSDDKNAVPNENNCSLASEYERFLNEVNPSTATDESISLEAQLREKLLKQMHHKGDGNEKSAVHIDYLSPSEKRTMEKMKKQQQKEQEKEESLKRQENLKSAPLNTYYSTKRNASDTVVDMETSNSPKDYGNNMEPFSKTDKDIAISFSDGKVKKETEKKVDVEDEKKLTAKELLDKIKKKKENEKVGDPPKSLRRFGNLPVIGKRPTKKTTANSDAVTPEQLIYNMNADYNYYVHYYMSTYGLDAYSAAYYAQYVMLTNGEYAYADTTLWMKHQGYVVTDATSIQQQQQQQLLPVQPGAAVEASAITNAQEEKVNVNENNENENKNDESELIKSETKSESTDAETKCENSALTGNKSPLPKYIEVVIPNTPLSATEMYLMNDASKSDDLNRFRVNSKSNGEDSGVGESPSPPPPPPPPMRPQITSFVTTTPITLPNGEQLPAGATQLIVHPYSRTHPLVDNFSAEEFNKAYESSRKKSDLNVQ